MIKNSKARKSVVAPGTNSTNSEWQKSKGEGTFKYQVIKPKEN